MKNRKFGWVEILLLLLVLAVFFQEITAVIIRYAEIIALILLVYVLYRLFFTAKKAVLFDFGGVVAEGDYFTEPIRVRKGIPEFVKSLKSRNYKVALLTNQNAAVQDCLDRKLGLDKMFPERIVSGKVGVKKPDPKIYQYALERLNTPPGNVYVIDDDPKNVAAAQKLGLRGIHFRSLAQVRSALGH